MRRRIESPQRPRTGGDDGAPCDCRHGADDQGRLPERHALGKTGHGRRQEDSRGKGRQQEPRGQQGHTGSGLSEPFKNVCKGEFGLSLHDPLEVAADVAQHLADGSPRLEPAPVHGLLPAQGAAGQEADGGNRQQRLARMGPNQRLGLGHH